MAKERRVPEGYVLLKQRCGECGKVFEGIVAEEDVDAFVLQDDGTYWAEDIQCEDCFFNEMMDITQDWVRRADV